MDCRAYSNLELNESQGKTAFNFSFEMVNKCPLCHHAIRPIPLFSHLLENFEMPGTLPAAYAVLLMCPNCSRYFLQLGRAGWRSGDLVYEMETSFVYPQEQVPPSFSQIIKSLSQQFVAIYTQSASAESNGLNEIAGMGYRKAFEFLIKDYLIKEHDTPEEQEKIKKLPLAKCITNYVIDPRIKDMASRAAWLGNDQTHYLKKHTDKDTKDLKILIDLTLRWIELELLTQEARQEIQFAK